MITCFGEIMLRLSPPGAYRIVQTDSYDAVYGGAESNTAVALSGFGEDVSYVTRLPENPIADACINFLRRYGVDTSEIVRGGERIGVYYLEKGAGVRPSRVIYDRKHSAISESTRTDFDWEKLLSQTNAFFFTGITPAVCDPSIVRDALEICAMKRIPVFCDLNYRPTLWSEKKAGETMRSLVRGIDTLIANEEHCNSLLGITEYDKDGDEKLRSVCEKCAKEYGIKRIVLTMRESISSDDNAVCAVMYDSEKNEFAKASRYTVHIVDRVGAGDALSAGIIFSRLHGFGTEETVNFGTAANAYKHSCPGDTLVASAEEILRVAQSDGTVRMVR